MSNRQSLPVRGDFTFHDENVKNNYEWVPNPTLILYNTRDTCSAYFCFSVIIFHL